MSDIAINPVTRRVQFTGNTGTGPFAFTFNILTDGDIAVYKNTTALTLTADYSVTINVNGTGSVTLVAALVSTDVLTIIGGRQLARTTDFVTAGDLLASSLNEQLDSNVIMAQQLDEKLGRGLYVNPGDVYTDLELPLKDARKGTVLGFNATTGDPEPGPEISDVDSLAAISGDIKTLAEIQDGTVATDAITNVNTIRANVTTVAGISGNVTTVAGIASDVTAVAADATDIGTVAGQTTQIGLLGTADAVADMNTLAVAGIITDMDIIADNVSGIGVVAGDIGSVIAVAINASNINTVAADGTDIGTVATSIASVNTAATNIASINTNATNIAAIQGASANAATATTKASEAAASESTATTQAGIATTKAGESAASATASATSASASEAAKDAALAALDNFDDRYLGAKASDPTLDNDGNALVSGALYFNTTDDVMKVYTGSAWVAAYASLTGALLVNNNLSDLASAATARTNLGLGTAATSASTDFVAVTGDTMTGNLDVTGTVTADGLTVETAQGDISIANSASSLNFARAGINYVRATDASGSFRFITGADDYTTDRITIASNGDISFYEDTGTTAKFFWDASTERLGIGTATPNFALTVRPTSSQNLAEFRNIDGSDNHGLILTDGVGVVELKAAYSTNAPDLTFNVGNSERMRIDSTGKVGIGTAAPSSPLQVYAPTGSIPALGAASSHAAIGAGSFGTMIGTKSTGVGYIQQQRFDGTATAYDLLLQPNGGKVGIGTAAPASKLEIASVDDTRLRITDQRNGNVVIGDPKGGLDFYWSDTSSNFPAVSGSIEMQAADIYATKSAMVFKTNDNNFSATERMRIDNTGKMGIGNAAPATTLDVTGTVTATSFAGDGSALTGIAAGATGGGSDDIFYENGQNVTTNYTITNGKNAMSAGPITVDSGVTVTVGAGETWTVV